MKRVYINKQKLGFTSFSFFENLFDSLKKKKRFRYCRKAVSVSGR